MDLCLINTSEGTQIRIASIHGMLWLQTHFEEAHWESIANDQVRISNSDAKELSIDAQEAGIILSELPVISAKISSL
tara:strand:- start:14720 stop:14950 length:231 start_codon:yes stop_codon:yes gene_type:complete